MQLGHDRRLTALFTLVLLGAAFALPVGAALTDAAAPAHYDAASASTSANARPERVTRFAFVLDPSSDLGKVVLLGRATDGELIAALVEAGTQGPAAQDACTTANPAVQTCTGAAAIATGHSVHMAYNFLGAAGAAATLTTGGAFTTSIAWSNGNTDSVACMWGPPGGVAGLIIVNGVCGPLTTEPPGATGALQGHQAAMNTGALLHVVV